MGDVDDDALAMVLERLATVKRSVARRLVETADD
jgi:hypothetical protein